MDRSIKQDQKKTHALMSMLKAKTMLRHTAAVGTLIRRMLVRVLPMQWDRANITNTMEDCGVVSSTSVHQVTYG